MKVNAKLPLSRDSLSGCCGIPIGGGRRERRYRDDRRYPSDYPKYDRAPAFEGGRNSDFHREEHREVRSSRY